MIQTHLRAASVSVEVKRHAILIALVVMIRERAQIQAFTPPLIVVGILLQTSANLLRSVERFALMEKMMIMMLKQTVLMAIVVLTNSVEEAQSVLGLDSMLL